MLLALLLMLPLLPGCVHGCPLGYGPAFFVRVTSEATGADVCDATVTAIVGTQTIALQVFDQIQPGTCNYQNAAEPYVSAGAYRILVTAPRLQAVTVDTSIQLDDCGSDIPQHLTVVMKSAP